MTCCAADAEAVGFLAELTVIRAERVEYIDPPATKYVYP
ncbi:MAG: hypothetical protein HPY66_2408 [Firmicutes bacterium]|nr:hypothetical protein [Bacillota bacterium]